MGADERGEAPRLRVKRAGNARHPGVVIHGTVHGNAVKILQKLSEQLAKHLLNALEVVDAL